MHNLSERVGDFGTFRVNLMSIKFILTSGSIALLMQRRRDRINEKMKALQQLIPHSSKVSSHNECGLYWHNMFFGYSFIVR